MAIMPLQLVPSTLIARIIYNCASVEEVSELSINPSEVSVKAHSRGRAVL